MKTTTIIRLELKRLLASPPMVGGLLIVLMIGLQAINQGAAVIDHQRRQLAAGTGIEKEHRERMLRLHGTPDPRNSLYYLNFFTRHEPSSYAAMSIGLRDVNPFNLKIRLLALEGQLYDSEISNPATRVIGNFDLSFLLVFLYPLLIIALFHNLVSEDREGGIWPLLRSQARSTSMVVLIRVLIRAGLVTIVWGLTLGMAMMRLDLPTDSRLVMATLFSLLYLIFWFTLSTSFAISGHSSNRIALLLFGLWLMLTLVIPGSLNLALNHRLALTEAFEIVVRQREGYHRQWDVAKGETMRRFFTVYPEYSGFEAPADRFSWGWYFAAQHIGDLEAAPAASALRQKLLLRQRWTERLGWLIPTINLQTSLNRLARTDLESHLGYLDSIRQYHERLRRHFYPLLMSQSVGVADWPATPSHTYTEEHWRPAPDDSLLALLVVTTALLLAALYRIRRADRLISPA
jgi:ABC-2 type transport system permease protein